MSLLINLKESNDILNDIFKSSDERGDMPSVYFYRYIGFSDEKSYIEILKDLNKKLEGLGSKYIRFIDLIPVNANPEYTNKVINILKTQGRDIFNQGIEKLDTANLLNFTNFRDINLIAKSALKQILSLYYTNETSLNLSIAVNFICKLLIWCKDILSKLFILNNKIIPKIVYFGNIKKHEIYFLLLMSQCGCDVLFMNSISDCDFDAIDKYGKYTKKIEFLKRGFIDLGPVFSNKEIPHEMPKPKILESTKDLKIEKEPSLKAILIKDTTDLFKNLLKPLSSRIEFVQKPSLIIPVFFYVYLGVNELDDDSIGAYKNDLFKLDNDLKSTDNGYINFSSIPLDSYSNLYSRVQNIESGLSYNENHMELLLKRFLDLRLLPETKEVLLNNAIINGFVKTCRLFLEIEENNNITKAKNFFIKLIIWINEYFPKLYKNLNFSANPKILFFGNIKLQELLFLVFSSSIGIDIIYVSPSNDLPKEFLLFKNKDDIFVEIKLKCKAMPFDFPRSIIPIRKSTENYKVQREVQNVIFDDSNISLLRPWQFENKIVRPITLKSTFEEVKVLINEEARFRPEFSYDATNIYIPNLFVKIRGIHNDINEYWSDLRVFLNSPNSRNLYFLEKFPFTMIDIGVNESYFSYLIDDHKINRNKLFRDNYYRFGYLKTALQNLIIDKIDYLMNSDHIFVQENNLQFQLKIIKTLLNLSPQVIKMLELFDFPFIVPKLVIYHKNKEMFSIYDAITIALLNSCGADIVIFTPTNYNDIEPFIKDSAYDTFQLPKVNFNLNFNSAAVYSQPKKSFFKNIFK
ncbi:MAG: YceG family protein [Oscillospiraceae bacterium]|nr:YceG family protein [Oscillospiraceae bacterium]